MSTSIGLQAALAEIEKLGTQSIEVEEWSDADTGKPLKIYWKPLTPARIARYVGKKKSQANALIIVENAIDLEGNKLFNPGDHITLSKSGNFKTIGKIANAMLGEDESDDESEDDADPLE